MGKIKEMQTTQSLVFEILEAQPMARNSDNYLCYQVYKSIGSHNGIDIDSMSIPMFFLRMKDFGFLSTETIRRARQKIQADHPELRGCKKVEDQRTMNEEIYRNYARGIM